VSVPVSTVVAYRVRQAHQLTLRLAEDLSGEQLQRSPGPFAPSIAFHVWHTARWADLLQAKLREMTDALRERLGPGGEIWEAERLADQWGLDAGSLGGNATGMGMDDDASAALPLPPAERLLDYGRRAFAAMDEAVAVVGDEDLSESCTDQYGQRTSVGSAVISHVSHVNRHLGMIEALRGVLGVRGTATV